MIYMKIGIVTTWLERGAAYVSRTYMVLLQKAGHDVFIFARGGENEESSKSREWNESYVTRYTKHGNSTIDKKAFFKWILKNNLEIIFFNEQKDYNIVAETKKKYPHIKLGSYVDYYTESSRKWFSFFDFIICNTHRHMQALEEHKQKFYFKWGVDTDLYKPNIDFNNNQVTFFHSAGMSTRKGTDILINAFISGKCYEQSKLIIHTQIPINNFTKLKEEELRNFNIEIIEKTVPAPGLYYLGDVYVYPTRLDGLGLTMYEALSSGLPVITSDFPPMNEAVNPNIGYLIKIKDYYCRDDAYYYPMVICDETSLIEAMKCYISNPQIIKEQGKKARDFALENYNIFEKFQELSDIFCNSKTFDYDEILHREYKKYVLQRFRPYSWLTSLRIVSKFSSH